MDVQKEMKEAKVSAHVVQELDAVACKEKKLRIDLLLIYIQFLIQETPPTCKVIFTEVLLYIRQIKL